jgi:hypothetical protein
MSGPGKLEGVATSYGAVADIGGKDWGFRETFLPGSFAVSLANGGYEGRGVRGLYEHRSDALLGRTTAGTLALTDRTDGLHFSIDLPDTSIGNDVAELTRRGDLSGMSFSFAVEQGGDTWSKVDGWDFRTVKRAVLFEVSVVSDPAYMATTASMARSIDRRELEDRTFRTKLAWQARDIYGSLTDDWVIRAKHPLKRRSELRTFGIADARLA